MGARVASNLEGASGLPLPVHSNAAPRPSCRFVTLNHLCAGSCIAGLCRASGVGMRRRGGAAAGGRVAWEPRTDTESNAEWHRGSEAASRRRLRSPPSVASHSERAPEFNFVYTVS
jgi:hypothetical protein